MVHYNPKDWFTFIFKFHKADTFRQLLPLMVGIGLYSLIVGYLEMEYWQLSQNDQLKNITLMHSMLGFVISLLLAYRINTAYDRWWEGRKIWGQLTNNSRNLAMKIHSMLDGENDRNFFKKLIPFYAAVLDRHLKDEHTSRMLTEDTEFILEHNKHQPNQVARLMYTKVQELYRQQKISGEQLLFLNEELKSFTEICGACERIKNTPIPYSYSSFIKKFIFVYIMTLPFGYVFSLGYYVIPVVVFIFYVLASLEVISEEIEDPFGTDPNDLPITKMAENIKKHVNEIL